MEDHLTGDNLLKTISHLSYNDWTPDVAELVRQRLLGPSWQKSGWKEWSLGRVLQNITAVKHLTEDEKLLRNLGHGYIDYVARLKNRKLSSTAEESPPATSESSGPV